MTDDDNGGGWKNPYIRTVLLASTAVTGAFTLGGLVIGFITGGIVSSKDVAALKDQMAILQAHYEKDHETLVVQTTQMAAALQSIQDLKSARVLDQPVKR